MSKGIIYIDYDEALNIYGKMIDASDGGFEGVRDEGGIHESFKLFGSHSLQVICYITMIRISETEIP